MSATLLNEYGMVWYGNKHPLYMYCIYSDLFPGWRVANDITKPHFSINSNNSSSDCKNCNRKWQFAIGYVK